MLRRLFVSAFTLYAILAGSTNWDATAAKMRDVPIDELLENSPVVVAGRLQSMEEAAEDGVLYNATFEIDQVVKGCGYVSANRQVVVKISENILRCELSFDTPEQLLFLAPTTKAHFVTTYRKRSCVNLVQTSTGQIAITGVPPGQTLSMEPLLLHERNLPADIKRKAWKEDYVLIEDDYYLELPALTLDAIADSTCH